MKKLNIGCGTDIKKGWTNIDRIKTKDVDLIWDFNDYPYPFEDNSVDEIYASHILEHIKDFTRCFKEFTRILKVGGMFHIKVPHFSASISDNEFHHTKFEYLSFGYTKPVFFNLFSKESIELYGKYSKEYKRLNFYKKPYFPWNYFIEPIINLSRYFILFWEYTGLHNLFPARELEVILKKKEKIKCELK